MYLYVYNRLELRVPRFHTNHGRIPCVVLTNHLTSELEIIPNMGTNKQTNKRTNKQTNKQTNRQTVNRNSSLSLCLKPKIETTTTMLDNEEKYVGKDASSWSIDSKSPTHHSEIYIRIIIHIYPIPSIKNIDKNLPEILDPARESRLGWPKRPTSQSSGQKDRQKAFVGPTSVLLYSLV